MKVEELPLSKFVEKQKFDEKMQGIVNRKKAYNDMLQALREFEDSEKNREDIEKAMDEILCYGSIAFCCGPEKGCPMRNSFLQVLGLDIEDYKEMKEDMEEAFWNYEGLEI